MVNYDGKCYCGATEWSVDVPEEKHVLCHCGACKIMGGSAFSVNAIVPKKNFKLTKGNLKVYTYHGESGKGVDCFMCPECASSPYHHQHALGEDAIILRTSLLKGSEKWGKPMLEIFDAQRYSWLPQTADKSVPGPPPS